jgi:RimJ/RimL family protein N-acetyltransferase
MSLPLLTPRLLLRHFAVGDLPTLLAYRNDPEVAQYQFWGTFDEAGLLRFIEHMAGAAPAEPGAGFQFAIALRSDNTHIGDLFLRLLDYDERQAEFGYTLARPYWGMGYASEAVGRLLQYIFVERNLHRAIALVDCANTPSINLLERLGLRREGHFRQSIRQGGEWRDEYQYAILAEEWRERERVSR